MKEPKHAINVVSVAAAAADDDNNVPKPTTTKAVQILVHFTASIVDLRDVNTKIVIRIRVRMLYTKVHVLADLTTVRLKRTMNTVLRS